MRILLLGEYSRLHNSLKEGLQKLGHEVVLVSDGDSFKNLPSDFDISSRIKKNRISRFFGKIFFRFFSWDVFQMEKEFRLKKISNRLKGFDVVQLINQDPFLLKPENEIKILDKIFSQNKKIFLLACGDDTHVIDFYERKKMKYSILTPVHLGKVSADEMVFSYKYLQDDYKKIFDFLMQKVIGIIPTDLDYAIPYQNHPLAVEMIPNPVNVDKLQFSPLIIKDKIKIFHGVNTKGFYKKGSDIIINVLKKLQKRYPNKLDIQMVENLSYSDYIHIYQEAHIFIDQIYAYDQGYNALEAMAQGKCVVTGAEREFETYYQLKDKVAINSNPDENILYSDLEQLILHSEQIINIGKNARKFIEENHHYMRIAEKYLKIWNKKNPAK